MSGRKEAPLGAWDRSPSPLGKQVRTLRHQWGLSVIELARAVDLGDSGRGHISKIEHGHIRHVSDELLTKLARALHVSPVDLLASSFPPADSVSPTPDPADDDSAAGETVAATAPLPREAGRRPPGRVAEPHPVRDRIVGQLVRRFRRGRSRSTPAMRVDQSYMTQLELAQAVSDVAERQTGQKRALGESYINKIERGGVRLNQELLDVVSRALNATPKERTLLYEAAGYAGLVRYLADRLGIAIPPDVATLPERVADGRITVDQMATLLDGWVQQVDAALKAGEQRPPNHDGAEMAPETSPLGWPLYLVAAVQIGGPAADAPQPTFRHESCGDHRRPGATARNAPSPLSQRLDAIYEERTARSTATKSDLWAEVAMNEDLREACMRICRELWDAYRTDIFTFLVLMASVKEVADELLGRVFQTAFESSAFMEVMLSRRAGDATADATPDGDHQPLQGVARSYLFRIAYRTSIAYSMSVQAWTNGMGSGASAFLSDKALLPDKWQAMEVVDEGSDPEMAQLERALQTLPPVDRACLLLRFSRDFSASEIVDIVDMKPEVVDGLLNSAKERFRREMQHLVSDQPPAQVDRAASAPNRIANSQQSCN